MYASRFKKSGGSSPLPLSFLQLTQFNHLSPTQHHGPVSTPPCPRHRKSPSPSAHSLLPPADVMRDAPTAPPLQQNDDGPPTPSTGNSPFVYPFARALVRELGWDVRVVVPSGQRSWCVRSKCGCRRLSVTGASLFALLRRTGSESRTRLLNRSLDNTFTLLERKASRARRLTCRDLSKTARTQSTS